MDFALTPEQEALRELGRRILSESGLNFTIADGMKDAAEKVVRLAQ